MSEPTDARADADELTDVRYEEENGLAWITIDRSERLNAFTAQSFNLESEQLAGQAALAFSGLHEFVGSAEAQEGIAAFNERRPPDFAPFRGHASRPL